MRLVLRGRSRGDVPVSCLRVHVDSAGVELQRRRRRRRLLLLLLLLRGRKLYMTIHAYQLGAWLQRVFREQQQYAFSGRLQMGFGCGDSIEQATMQ